MPKPSRIFLVMDPKTKKLIGVGVGVIVQRGSSILLGMRKGSRQSGTWAPPGGHLDFGETWKQCALREVFEETGMNVYDPEVVDVFNDIDPDDSHHYIAIILKVKCALSEDPILMEPDKCEAWKWFSWDNLPTPLFSSLSKLKETHPNLLSTSFSGGLKNGKTFNPRWSL